MEPTLQVVADTTALARVVAELFVSTAEETVARTGRFTVALSGGSTPKALYALITSDDRLRERMPWQKTVFFFGDERCVPPDHPDSNYKSANDGMLSKVAVDPSQVFRMKGEYSDTERAAREYEEQLRQVFSLAPGQLPRIDLNMLGMGPDGHCASLFPGTKGLKIADRLVISNWVGKFYTHRITMTAPVLNNSAYVLFMIAGKDKAQALKAVLEGPHEPEQLPTQLIRPANANFLWVVDEAAAALLDRNNTRVKFQAARG